MAMTLEELHAIVAGGEQAQVEFKRTTGQRSEGAKAACAMLNGAGGFVLFGVRDDGTVEGQDIATRTLEDVVHELRRVEPPLPIEPDVVPLGPGRGVLVLRVPAHTGGPYTYDARPYVRQGPTTQLMPQADYRRRLLEALSPGERWEALPTTAVTVAQLDQDEIIRTVDAAVRRGWLSAPEPRDPELLLDRLGVRRDGLLLNGAAALFLREEHALPYYPQLLLKLARFRGGSKAVMDDGRQDHGHLFAQLRRAQRFLREHLPIASRVVAGQFEREDTPLLPVEALRETLLNALCHRDYHTPSGSVSVAIFDDRVEIANTGWLASGITPELLRGPHTSRPWNPIIAGVLHPGRLHRAVGRWDGARPRARHRRGAPAAGVRGAGRDARRDVPRARHTRGAVGSAHSAGRPQRQRARRARCARRAGARVDCGARSGPRRVDPAADAATHPGPPARLGAGAIDGQPPVGSPGRGLRCQRVPSVTVRPEMAQSGAMWRNVAQTRCINGA